MLTWQQKKLLTFIDSRVTETGVTPSFDEMRAELGLNSKSGISRLIAALEERGFIRRLSCRARAIEVIRFPGRSYITPMKMAEMVRARDKDWRTEFFEYLCGTEGS